jgi:hypothetical protein
MNHLFFPTLVAYVASFAAYVAYLRPATIGSAVLARSRWRVGFSLLRVTRTLRGLHTVPYHDLSGSMSLFGWLLALTYLSLNCSTASVPSAPSCFRSYWRFHFRPDVRRTAPQRPQPE